MAVVEQLPLISISIIGHVDSGKSTLCGRLATEWGGLDARQQAKLQQIAEANSKGSFAFAYFTDKTEAERKRGVTINTTLVEMKTKKFRINFLDCPGHADYIKNATSGCKQSDLSVVVVPADFQASCSADGTLKTHLTLAAVLGSKNFIVCINKIDEVAAKNKADMESTFDAASAAVGKLLKKLNVKLENVIFLPISALHGVGLFRGKEKFDFYKGQKLSAPKNGFEVITCLEDAIDCQDIPARPMDKPLRMPLSSVAHVPGQGTIFCGRVDYGSIKKDDAVKFLPTGVTGTVKNVQAHKQDVPVGEAGMNIGFSFYTKEKVNVVDKIAAGHMVGPADDASFQLYPFYVVQCVSMKGKAKAGQEEKGIKVGYTPVVSCGTSNIASKFVKLINCTGKDNVNIENPTMIPKDSRFSALIYPSKQALFENYKTFPALGKLVCRDSGHLVCVGNVTDCVSMDRAVNEFGVNMAEVTGVKAAPAAGADKKKAKK